MPAIDLGIDSEQVQRCCYEVIKVNRQTLGCCAMGWSMKQRAMFDNVFDVFKQICCYALF